MKTINLTQNKVAIVDDDDYERLIKFCWYYEKGYAKAKIPNKRGEKKTLGMSAMVIGTIPGLEIDHVNRDGCDNRKENLRHCTRSQNESNKGKSKGSSIYKGVYWHKGSGKWMAYIKKNQKCYHLGLYQDEKDAAIAYNAAAADMFGKFAGLNAV